MAGGCAFMTSAMPLPTMSIRLAIKENQGAGAGESCPHSRGGKKERDAAGGRKRSPKTRILVFPPAAQQSTLIWPPITIRRQCRRAPGCKLPAAGRNGRRTQTTMSRYRQTDPPWRKRLRGQPREPAASEKARVVEKAARRPAAAPREGSSVSGTILSRATSEAAPKAPGTRKSPATQRGDKSPPIGARRSATSS